jgi:hypothetical protein
MKDIDILVSEVGLRDGLQSIKSIMPTAAKKAWIAAEAAAGVREIEVASFVPAKLLPQMADAAEVVDYARTIPGLTVLALVPNFKGGTRSRPAPTSSPCPCPPAKRTAGPTCGNRMRRCSRTCAASWN